MKRATIGVVAVLAAALVGLLVYGVTSKSHDSTIDDAVKRGRRVAAPDRALPVLGASRSGSLADYRGKVVVLNFWASWCDPCRAEAPFLERTHRRIAGRGGTVLGVTYNDASADALAFRREVDMTYPSLRDLDGKLYRAYGNTGVPETFVIDRRGRVATLFRGAIESQAELDRAVAPLLVEPR